ncbi:translation initiation factor IF-2 [Candidatus Marinamargulisbacteria bacterium SCGC AAA071-K20]|nr:translation initiation factor IF-2 [Candidatus Marinamargulisbacteria bacterium SCGC AAA071-K20]
MKLTELGNQLSLTQDQLFTFLRTSNIRLKKGAKVDPGTATRIKKLYFASQQSNESDNVDAAPKKVCIREKTLRVSELVEVLKTSLSQVMRVFLERGMLLNINSEVDQGVMKEVGKALEIEVEFEDTVEEEKIGLKTKMLELEQEAEDNATNLMERPPVIAVMGHVDHGKTSLLDSLRASNTVAREAGGITQHIGAYQITYEDKKYTFLDTPGHEAFTSIRARGAQITDIAVLVVAADEGVKPQTLEAIDHAQAADIPIIVAINKIDKPEANVENCKTLLSQHNLLAEDWGGKIVMVPLSAKTGEGIPNLIEMIGLEAEMLELKAEKTGFSKSVVIESHLSKQKGPVATVLIKTGCLKIGDNFVVGSSFGKIRAIFDDQGKNINDADPGRPVEILGLSRVPDPGDILEIFASEKICREKAEVEELRLASESQEGKQNLSMEALSHRIEAGDVKTLNIVLKTDVNGSLEAIKSSIGKIDNREVTINMLHASTGNITENDVMLAKASSGLVIGFQVSTSNEAIKLADEAGLIIKNYKVIYEVVSDIEKLIKGLYKPEFEEVNIAELEVRQKFKFSKVGIIAGCHVLSGKISRNSKVKIIREGNEVYNGDINSLKRFKEDVKEVSSGYDCGLVFEKFSDINEGDSIIGYEVRQKAVV